MVMNSMISDQLSAIREELQNHKTHRSDMLHQAFLTGSEKLQPVCSDKLSLQ